MTGSDQFRRLWRSPWLCALGLWLVYLAIAVFASWPLCLSPATTISFGFETEATVPLLNLWTTWWNTDRLANGFRGYWDAPIFYPTKGTFAFSEVQPTMVIVAPVVWLTGSRILAYNIYYLLIQSLNGISSRCLLRRLGYSPWLAFSGGVMCQMLPFIWWQSAVVQLTTLFGIVWTIHSLLDVFDPKKTVFHGSNWEDTISTFRFVGRLFSQWDYSIGRAVRRLLAEQSLEEFDWCGALLRGLKLGGSFGLTYLLCNYWGLYLAILLIPSSIWFWNASLLRLRAFLEFSLSVVVAFVVSLILIGPLVLVQRSLAREQSWYREQSLILELSAHARDYVDTPRSKIAVAPNEEPLDNPPLVTWSLFPGLDAPEDNRKDLWPLGGGSLKLILAPLGLAAALLTRGKRRWGIFAATFAAIAFGLSLGPTLWMSPWVPVVGGESPYELLQRYVPGFALIRSPFRFAMFFQLAIVWLSLEALDLLNPIRWKTAKLDAESPVVEARSFLHGLILPLQTFWQTPLSAKGTMILKGALIVSSLILVIEVWPPRQSLYACPTGPTPAWIQWLRENSSPGDSIVCLPLPTGYHVRDYEATTVWMYWGTFHRRPLVNGYSGFFPQDFVKMKEEMGRFNPIQGDPAPMPQLKLYPSDSLGLSLLNNWNVRFLVVSRSFATRDDVWQHPATKFRWAWVTADEQHDLDVYEMQKVQE